MILATRSEVSATTICLFDNHCHLQLDTLFSRVENILKNVCQHSVKYHVAKIHVCGVCPGSDWDRVSELSQRCPDIIIPSYGIHPWWIIKHFGRGHGFVASNKFHGSSRSHNSSSIDQHHQSDCWLKTLDALLTANPRAHIGECGLDKLCLVPTFVNKHAASLLSSSSSSSSTSTLPPSTAPAGAGAGADAYPDADAVAHDGLIACCCRPLNSNTSDDAAVLEQQQCIDIGTMRFQEELLWSHLMLAHKHHRVITLHCVKCWPTLVQLLQRYAKHEYRFSGRNSSSVCGVRGIILHGCSALPLDLQVHLERTGLPIFYSFGTIRLPAIPQTQIMQVQRERQCQQQRLTGVTAETETEIATETETRRQLEGVGCGAGATAEAANNADEVTTLLSVLEEALLLPPPPPMSSSVAATAVAVAVAVPQTCGECECGCVGKDDDDAGSNDCSSTSPSLPPSCPLTQLKEYKLVWGTRPQRVPRIPITRVLAESDSPDQRPTFLLPPTEVAPSATFSATSTSSDAHNCCFNEPVNVLYTYKILALIYGQSDLATFADQIRMNAAACYGEEAIMMCRDSM